MFEVVPVGTDENSGSSLMVVPVETQEATLTDITVLFWHKYAQQEVLHFWIFSDILPSVYIKIIAIIFMAIRFIIKMKTITF